VSLSPELAQAVDRAAAETGTSFSGWIADTVDRRLRLEAARDALAEWEREHGPLSAEERAEGRERARRSLGRS
jgi:hypothetical protein